MELLDPDSVPTSQAERRGERRINVYIPLTFSAHGSGRGDVAGAGTTINVSGQGVLFLCRDAPPEPGMRMTIELRGEGRSDRRTLRGFCVRVGKFKGNDAGVEEGYCVAAEFDPLGQMRGTAG